MREEESRKRSCWMEEEKEQYILYVWYHVSPRARPHLGGGFGPEVLFDLHGRPLSFAHRVCGVRWRSFTRQHHARPASNIGVTRREGEGEGVSQSGQSKRTAEAKERSLALPPHRSPKFLPTRETEGRGKAGRGMYINHAILLLFLRVVEGMLVRCTAVCVQERGVTYNCAITFRRSTPADCCRQSIFSLSPSCTHNTLTRLGRLWCVAVEPPPDGGRRTSSASRSNLMDTSTWMDTFYKTCNDDLYLQRRGS